MPPIKFKNGISDDTDICQCIELPAGDAEIKFQLYVQGYSTQSPMVFNEKLKPNGAYFFESDISMDMSGTAKAGKEMKMHLNMRHLAGFTIKKKHASSLDLINRTAVHDTQSKKIKSWKTTQEASLTFSDPKLESYGSRSDYFTLPIEKIPTILAKDK